MDTHFEDSGLQMGDSLIESGVWQVGVLIRKTNADGNVMIFFVSAYRILSYLRPKDLQYRSLL